jgi:hypothetical protein
MKFKNGTIGWDRFDEDRWIAASIVSLIVILMAFFILRSIRIPENPKKVTITEEIDFVKPDVKKKVIQPKKEQAKIPEEKIIEENPEIVLNILMETPQNNTPMLPQQNLAFADEFKIFEQENETIEQAQAITQITDGLLLQESEFDPIDINKGLPSDRNSDNIKSTIITPNIGDRSLKGNMGISSTINANEQILSNNFKGFTGDIEWEEMLDPILEWIKNHASPIGQVPTFKLTKNDNTATTAREIISINNVKYELLLGCKIEKKQITICLVNLSDNKYVMLVDQGLTKTSTVFNTGKIRRNEEDQIIHFREGTYKNARDPEAQEFMKIFWQWARSVTNQG